MANTKKTNKSTSVSKKTNQTINRKVKREVNRIKKSPIFITLVLVVVIVCGVLGFLSYSKLTNYQKDYNACLDILNNINSEVRESIDKVNIKESYKTNIDVLYDENFERPYLNDENVTLFIELDYTLNPIDKIVNDTLGLNVSNKVSKDVTIKSVPIVIENNLVKQKYDFNDYDDSDLDNEDNIDGITAINSTSYENMLKLSYNNSNPYFIIDNKLEKNNSVSFLIKGNSNVTLNIYKDNSDEVYYSKLIQLNGSFIQYNLDKAMDANFVYKFEFVTNEDIYIDDIVILSDYSDSDIKNLVLNDFPSNYNKLDDLPKKLFNNATISYDVDSLNLKDGKLVLKENEEVVTITVTVNYDSRIIRFVVTKSLGDDVEVYFIDIGLLNTSECGESTYIKVGDIDVIIDSGSTSKSGEAIINVVNEHSNDKVIDYVIATHPDRDHIGGMPALFSNYTILNCIKFVGKADSDSQVFKDFKASYEEEAGCNVIEVTSFLSKSLELSSNCSIDFIDTGFYNYGVENPTKKFNNIISIVCTLNVYDTKILFTGDSDDIIKQYKDKVGNIDILKVAHHGSKIGTAPEFVSAIDPEVAIICNGTKLGNKYKHPHYETLQNLYDYDANMKVYAISGGKAEDCNSEGVCTNKTIEDYMWQRNGTITLIITSSGYTLSSEYYNDNPMEMKNTDFYKYYRHN